MTFLIESIPDKYYIGFKFGKDFDTEDAPLAFMTPFGTDAAFKKRKATVDDWCTGYEHVKTGKMLSYNRGTSEKPEIVEYPESIQVRHEGKTYEIDNEWREGFKFTAVRSRYSTSNKVFQIEDPRGFILEVYSDNLGELLLDGSIADGLILGRHKWARYNGKPYLLKEDGIVHKRWLETQVKRDEVKSEPLIPGDIWKTEVNDKTGNIYIGDYFSVDLDFEYQSDIYGYYWSNRKPRTNKYKFVVSKILKPWKLSVWNTDTLEHRWIHDSRAFSKKTIKIGRDEDKLNDIRADFEGLLGTYVSYYGALEDYEKKNPWSTSRVRVWFETKKDMQDWLAVHEPNNFQEARDLWQKAHPPNADFVSVIVEGDEE